MEDDAAEGRWEGRDGTGAALLASSRWAWRSSGVPGRLLRRLRPAVKVSVSAT